MKNHPRINLSGAEAILSLTGLRTATERLNQQYTELHATVIGWQQHQPFVWPIHANTELGIPEGIYGEFKHEFGNALAQLEGFLRLADRNPAQFLSTRDTMSRHIGVANSILAPFEAAIESLPQLHTDQKDLAHALMGRMQSTMADIQVELSALKVPVVRIT